MSKGVKNWRRRENEQCLKLRKVIFKIELDNLANFVNKLVT